MAINIKGASLKLFLAGLVFLLLGTILMIWAEGLSGWANVGKANTIVPIGITSLVVGGLLWVFSYISSKK